MAKALSAELLRAVAHPLRLAILCCLEKEGDLTTRELVDRLHVAPAQVRRHLRELRAAGLVSEAPRPGRHRVMRGGWSEISRRLGRLAGGGDAVIR